MWLMPEKKLILKSDLKPDDLILRLSDRIEFEKPINWKELLYKGGSKEFAGHIENNEINVRKLNRRKNAFIPIIEAKVEPSNQGSIIYTSIRPTKFATNYVTYTWPIQVIFGLAYIFYFYQFIYFMGFHVLVFLGVLYNLFAGPIIYYQGCQKSISLFKAILKAKEKR